MAGKAGGSAAVPVMLAFDLDGGKSGRQRTARHHVLGPDRVRRVVEIDEIAGTHVDGSDAETGGASIQTVEIHQTLECALEIFGVVEAGGLDRAAWLQPRIHRPGGEKPAGPARERPGGAHQTAKIACGIAARGSEVSVTDIGPKPVGGHLCPKLAQPIGAGIRRIAGNDGRIDRPNRDAGDPIGMYSGLREGLVDAGLIGPERAAALQHERHAFEGKIPLCRHDIWLYPHIHGTLSISVQ
jgi:hypothetical protein